MKSSGLAHLNAKRLLIKLLRLVLLGFERLFSQEFCSLKTR